MHRTIFGSSRRSTRGTSSIAVFAGLLGLGAARTVEAQRPNAAIVGWIRDSAGKAVAAADIEIESNHAFARSDTSGRFALKPLAAGKTIIRVRRLGYEPQSFEFTLHQASEDSISVTLQENAQLLAAVRTNAGLDKRYKALEDFYRRRAKGFGVFITREDIEQHHTNTLSETLREVPGVRVVRAGTSRAGLRFDSANSKRYDCPPQYWIDGRRVTNTEIDDYPASDVEAIELYRGPSTTPMQFSQGTVVACGTVVIWTRIPGLPTGQ